MFSSRNVNRNSKYNNGDVYKPLKPDFNLRTYQEVASLSLTSSTTSNTQ